MKILITGASGMLGTELCEILGVDNEIVGVDVIKIKDQRSKIKVFYEESIVNFEKIETIFANEKPELVIHTAAWTDVDGCEKNPKKAYSVNVVGTHNIAAICSKEDVPLIFISTDFVFDGSKKSPYVETDSACPISAYGKTKYEAEGIVKRALANYVILRTCGLYGRNGNNFVDTIREKARIGEDLMVVDDQVVSPTYTYDLACALKRFISIEKSIFSREIYHVANRGQCSWYIFAREIVKNIKGAGGVVVKAITSQELARSAPRPSFSVLDSSKFEGFVGSRLRPWQEALAAYMENKHECL